MKRIKYFSCFKQYLFLGIVGFVLTLPVSISAQDISSGLILHYTFDTPSNDTVNDNSGNNNIGIMHGSAVYTPGFTGQGLSCVGKTDYIEAPDDITVGLTSFTFACWAKFSQLKDATRFFDWGNGTDGSNNFLAFIPSFGGDNRYMNLRYRPASGTAYNVTSTSKCALDKWEHVALTFNWDGSSATATIYLNGQPVGSVSDLSFNPMDNLGPTNDNYFGYSRWAQDANGFNGTFDDLRVYSRCLTPDDILALTGLDELYLQYDNLDLGDISSVTNDITLPTILGVNGVNASWASSDSTIIDNGGHVTIPENYDRKIMLTATLSYDLNGTIYTLEKSFLANVVGPKTLPEHLCKWNFDSISISQSGDTVKVTDKTGNKLTGTLMNSSIIRTIGNTNRFNVLYTGEESGYFDMGTEIGKAIYSLNDFTIMSYFRIDNDYTDLTNPGNFLWTFSNSDDILTDKNGYITYVLGGQNYRITSDYYSNDVGLNLDKVPETGNWHHVAYVQDSVTGYLYIDGVLAKTDIVTKVPSLALAKEQMSGTLYNWLGRSCYTEDNFLQKTMIYDFTIYSKALTVDDLSTNFAVGDTIALLNTAYNEDPDHKPMELEAEYNALLPENLDSLKTDIDLPIQGTTYPGVNISWTSDRPDILSSLGVVNRPDYFDADITLTATLTYGVYTMVKSFKVKVIANEGTSFTSDLLMRYDFSNLDGPTVQDVAEKHFKGTLKNSAKVVTIGNSTTGIYNVLSLGTSSGYFDMGTDPGKVISKLKDYTLCAYYRIDEDYSGLSKAGNFIWNFSNSANAPSDKNGYIIGNLSKQSNSITPGYYPTSSGNQAISFEKQALKGNWHHIAYTQNGTTGSIFIDGLLMASGEITNLPFSTLKKDGLDGTLYNWIGRSCYPSDSYLQKTLVYDLRLYSKALTEQEILETELGVPEHIAYLENAYHAFIGDSKTEETVVAEKTTLPKPSHLYVFKRNNTADKIELSSIENITFPENHTQLNGSSNAATSFLNDDIVNMVFSDGSLSSVSTTTIKKMDIYPNPANNSVYFQNMQMNTGHILIYSISGQLITTETVKSSMDKIDISQLPSGIYVIKAGYQVSKFVKK